jgi:uncharacterized protein YciU (UPF0263 family)
MAAFSKFKNTVVAGGGVWQWMTQMFRDEPYPLKVNDFTDILKEISTVNSIAKSIAAFNTGRWLSKKELTVDTDIEAANNVFMTLTGLQRQQASDVFLKIDISKDRESVQNKGEEVMIREFRRGLRAAEDQNTRQAADYFQRAKVALIVSGYPEEKWGQAYSKAATDHEDLITRIDWDFYQKDLPISMKDEKYKAMRKTEALKQARRP